MGRPIKSSNFGSPTLGRRLACIADIGSGNEYCYFLKQRGYNKYRVASINEPTRQGNVTLQQATPTAVGQAQLDCYPIGAGGDGNDADIQVASAGIVSGLIQDPGTTATVVGATLTVAGGTRSIAATFTVSTIQAATATINEGGTGYVIGDILTVVGGTKTEAATLEVTNVTDGVISGVTVRTGGNYTVRPTGTPSAVQTTGGTGGGAGFDMVFGPRTITNVNQGTYTVAPTDPATFTGNDATATFFWRIKSFTIVDGGQNYTTGASIVILGSSSAEIYVGGVDGNGAITSIVIDNGGDDISDPFGEIFDIESTNAEQVKKLSQHRVLTFQGNTYTWVVDEAAAVGGPSAVIQTQDNS